MRPPLSRQSVAELLGTALLVCAVVGSGIMAERLAGGNAALALLANTLATAGALLALIYAFAPISGAHFNPCVTLIARFEKIVTTKTLLLFTLCQVTGGIIGAVIANLMFDLPAITMATKTRGGSGQVLAEFIATFGLIFVIHGTSKTARVVPISVAAYIAAAYWFTSSTSFANPAVTIARMFSDSFAGIHPSSVGAFISAQIIGAITAFAAFRWLALKSE